MRTEDVDVLVIGAGPAGSVAASILNNNNFTVKVVEKQIFPRFVIGESLLPRCLDNFEKAGLIDTIKAQGYQIKNGASFSRREEEYCAFDFADKHTKGYPHAWQMPRADLDKALIDACAKNGVEVCYQHSVIDAKFTEKEALVTISDATQDENYQVRAKFVVDASGYGRVLPRLLDLNKPSNFPARTAFFAHVEDTERPEGAELVTEILDLQGIWAWVIPFSNGITSIGFVTEKETYEALEGKDEKDKYCRLLQQHHTLKDRFNHNSKFVLGPKAIGGYSIGVKRMYGNRFVLVGNATEFLDPVFSSGVTFATESGSKAAELIVQQLNGQQVDWEKEYAQYMQRGIEVFKTYVKEWYNSNLQTIFFASSKTPNIKRQICSVLAGYVWDETNPYVKKHKKAIPVLVDVIKMQKIANSQ